MTQLKPFNVTIRVFDPGVGQTIADYVLPVDSPDAEHAAASFTTKMEGDVPARIAFRVMAITGRR